MRDQIVVSEQKFHSEKFGDYKIKIVKPAAARVSLVSFTSLPKDVMYLATRAYKGIYDTLDHYNDPDYYSREQAFDDIMNTKLQTPLEMVHTLWLLNDVTRAFTHQLVRYRVGTSFIQESMRFLGMKKEFKVLVTGSSADTVIDEDEPYSNFEEYVSAVQTSILSYVDLIERGVPSEDARGVLPTNILTSIYFDCSFRTLQGLFPQRLCCQAQPGEWQPILQEMRRQIKASMGEELEALLRAPYELGKDCGYRASFDRPCKWNVSEPKIIRTGD